MPRERFQILVEVLNCADKQTAIATAGAKLAYADQTDTIGYAPDIKNVYVHSDGDGPLSVDLTVEVAIENDEHLKQFMDELAALAPVMSVERVRA